MILGDSWFNSRKDNDIPKPSYRSAVGILQRKLSITMVFRTLYFHWIFTITKKG